MIAADRRRFVASVATVTAGAAALPASARAFSYVEPGTAVRESYANACNRRAFHDELVADVRRTLAEQGHDIGEDTVRAALETLSCPLCGCRLSAAVDAPK